MIFPYIGCKWNIVNFTNADMRKNWHTCWEMTRRKRETTISLSVLLLVLLKKQNRKRKEGWLNFSNGPSWFDWLVILMVIPCKTTATREQKLCIVICWCARVHVSLRVSRGLRGAYASRGLRAQLFTSSKEKSSDSLLWLHLSIWLWPALTLHQKCGNF